MAERDQAGVPLRESFCRAIRVKESLFTCIIPSGFMTRSVPELGHELALETRDGSTWNVGLVKLCGETFIERGWRAFCMDNRVEVDDIVLFELVDGGKLRVRFYDADGTEKLKVAEEQHDGEGEGEKEEGDPAPPAASITPEKNKAPAAEVVDVVNDSGPGNVREEESGVDEKKGGCRRRKKTHVTRRLATQFDDLKDANRPPKKHKAHHAQGEEDGPSRERSLKDDDGFEVTEPDHVGRKSKKKSSNLSSESSSSARHKSPKVSKGSATSALSALAAAREFRSENPFAVIPMVKSCLGPSFLLHLPKQFAKAWNSTERNVILLGDKDRKFPVRYIERRAVSAGWGGFAKAHGIAPRDCIVLEAIDASTLRCRVYRAADSEEPGFQQ